jgi:acetyl-CoA carboxylase carboxyltransferase component
LCDAFNVPLVFFQDVPGFMVGAKAEKGGIIHAGSRMIQAMARARVPRVTVILRKAYGAGQYALCGPGFAPQRVIALPTAETGTMAAETLANVVYGEAIALAKTDAQRAAIVAERDRVVARHIETLDAAYAASKGWYDTVVLARDLRRTLTAEIAFGTAYLAERPLYGRRAISLT